MKSNEIKQFYEIFAPLSIDPIIGNGNNYTKAVTEAQKQLNEIINSNNFEKIKQFLRSQTNTTITQMLWYGSPWGYYHQQIMNNDRIFLKGVKFYNTSVNMVENNNNFNRNNDRFDSMNPFYELIKFGTFSNETINTLSSPLNYAIDAKWVNLLHKSMDLFGETWLHCLHIAIALHSNTNDVVEIRNYYQKSLNLKETVIAYRGLALLSDSMNETIDWYIKATNIAINVWQTKGSPSLNPNINYGTDNEAVLVKNCRIIGFNIQTCHVSVVFRSF